ncbi:Anaphase-promoting complex subunit 2 [Escovopsis weberi]|uniref:Anaphase-promoting complex subunit 2 n=1 Tax=Escovopsis weberi TaxID=150374 RepID=A0A0M8MZS2_ESCWE|nr:Anaphase-promoting complex subunit 2 [Escovopsis weberi]
MASTAAAPPVSRVRRQRLKTFRAVFPADVPHGPGPGSGPGSAPSDPFVGARVPASSSARASRSAAVTRSIAASASASAPPPPPSSSSSSSSSSLPPPPPSSSQLHAASASASADQLRWDRAWHTVTARIRLPSSVAVEDSFGALATESQDLDRDAAFHHALAIVLDAPAAMPLAARTEDVLAWHGAQVRHHFVHHVLPLLAACAGHGGASDALLGIVETLEAAHRQYSYGLRLIARGFRDDDNTVAAAVAGFHRDLHALVSNSWTPGLMQALRAVLQHTLRVILASPGPPRAAGRGAPGWDGGRGKDVERSRAGLFRLIESLQKVGLAGEKFQVLFAEVMDLCMQDFIRDTYSGVWERPKTRDSSSRPGTGAGAGAAGSGAAGTAAAAAGAGPATTGLGTGTGSGSGTPCMDHLGNWIETCYGRLAVEVLSRLGGQVAWSDVERWRDIAIGRLATLRMHELFDIVLHWPRSSGGLDDLALAVTTPQRRLQLTDTFSAALQRRLLHPGRSTLDILQTYISMIRTFHALDHSKVLLDRVVPALKLCLWMRDDAIRIVVTGLLANPAENSSSSSSSSSSNSARPGQDRGKLVELAAILNEASQQQRRPADDEDLDWADMSWVPDPVDAGANYKRPRNEDIIGTLINALGLEDVFIKEFQAIIAERLLSPQPAFHQEIKVLGLLKKRFGDAALQNCDVMARDIADSKRVDAALARAVHGETGTSGPENSSSSTTTTTTTNTTTTRRAPPPPPAFHAKILSRLFWPSLSKEHFALPAPVAAVQRRYSAGFEKLKTSRKLSWLDHLGSATVRLDLRDRTVELECKTYEAAVIYEFQGSDDYNNNHNNNHNHNDVDVDAAPQRRHFNDLWQKLMMDEDLLDSALRFWVSQNVLRDIGDQTYIVLERLDDPAAAETTAAAAAGATATAAAAAAAEVDAGPASPHRAAKTDSKERERRAVYWRFIVGMLTNSSPAMPLAQIGMMMKMLIADGCAWGADELQAFLAERVATGELEFAGGKYRLPKK